MSPTRRRLIGAVGIGLAASLAGCSGDGDADGGTDGNTGAVTETTSVAMVDTQFDPRNIRVAAGTTVTWTNEDSAAHTVTSASDNWAKDTDVAGGEQTTHTFEQSGVYDVYCAFHGSSNLSGMSMKVGVGDATIESPLGAENDSGGGGYY